MTKILLKNTLILSEMLIKRHLSINNVISVKNFSTIDKLDTRNKTINSVPKVIKNQILNNKSNNCKNQRKNHKFKQISRQLDVNSVKSDDNIRFNPFGIQMISSTLREKLFGKCVDNYDKNQIKEIIKQLRAQGLTLNDVKPNQLLSDINIEKYLPKLLGNDLSKHFHVLGEKFSENYKQLIFNLIESQIPEPPKEWILREGWTRYSHQSNGELLVEKVEFPLENDLVFDVEVCMNDSNGQRPTLATALSSKAWYSWCSQRLIDFDNQNKTMSSNTSLNDMISMGSAPHSERLIVGHNVSFDRTYIKEQYDIDCDKTRFLDTLSLHMCVSGLTQHQRALSYSQKIRDNDHNLNESIDRTNPQMWRSVGSLNNLVDVYRLYCDSNEIISKDPRNIFIDGSISDVLNDFQHLMTYCSKDVSITHKILKSVFSKFIDRFPHPITLAAMLEMSVMYLPIIPSHWNRYISESDSIYDINERELNLTLRSVANDACPLAIDKQYSDDVWLWDLNWETQHIRFKKPKPEKIANKRINKNISDSIDKSVVSYGSQIMTKVMATTSLLKKVQPLMPGYPKWYLEFCSKLRYDFSDEREVSPEDLEWEAGPHLISTQMRSVPKLLRLLWNLYPLHYDDKHGWGYLTPDPTVTDTPDRVAGGVDHNKNIIYFPMNSFKQIIKIRENIIKNSSFNQSSKSISTELEDIENDFNDENIKPFNDVIKGCLFYRLPHKGGPDKRVGNPLGKDFLKKATDGSLTSFDSQLTDCLVFQSKRLSYWKNASKRIRSQIAISCNDDKSGAILPRVIVAGTVTRRAVEQTWLTASNAITDRLGSELKSMIQCPEGYNYVGADVDSQELWIASLIGDSHFSKLHGSTGIGWMTLQGDREKGTDMHSKTAQSINISRDEAKVLNYARIYGSGQSFASRFLMQSNPSLSANEAKEKAKKIFSETKGRKKLFKNRNKNNEISKSNTDLTENRRQWTGGSESQMFNKLELIAKSEEPRTPVLNCRISRALEPRIVGDHYMTSRVNWIVQSSAVDFLHILLISMKWLFEEMQIDGRFSISIHDEVRYIVKQQHVYKAALALQLSNLLTRSLFSQKLGLNDLPLSVSFFSRIDIDKCIRKEVDMDSKTPSNPLGLKIGYGIPFGESINISQLIEKLTQI